MATVIGEHTEHTFTWTLQTGRVGKTLQAHYVDEDDTATEGGTTQGGAEGDEVSITSDTGPNGMNLAPGVYRIEVTYEADDGTTRPVALNGVDRVVRIPESHSVS